jgi:CheY-like chemotaxis protein
VSKRILVVEDQPDNRQIVRDISLESLIGDFIPCVMGYRSGRHKTNPKYRCAWGQSSLTQTWAFEPGPGHPLSDGP